MTGIQAGLPGPYAPGSDTWPGLSRLAEDAGEIVQVIGMVISSGGRDPQDGDGTGLRARMQDELGGLLAAAGYVVAKNGLDWTAVNRQRDRERTLLEKRHHAGQAAIHTAGGEAGEPRGHSGHRRAGSGWDSLTPAETGIAGLVGDGLSNPDIAARLVVSRRTVATHVSHILQKLGVSSRADIAREAALRTMSAPVPAPSPTGSPGAPDGGDAR